MPSTSAPETTGAALPSWGPDESLPNPLWDARLLGGRGGRAGVLWIVLLLAGVLASRCAVLPASVWDRDEAHLGLAVMSFDPVADRPHAPWFPLWVAAGKALDPLVSEPARGLQVASAVLSGWTLFPLAALNAIWMTRRLAVAAAALYLFAPGPWLLSGRAYSDTPAAFLLVLTAAWWLRPAPRRVDLLQGSAAAGLCVLVRPQLGLVVAGMAAWCWLRSRGRAHRIATVGPLALALVAGGLGLVMAASGVASLRHSFHNHLRYHLAGLPDADHGFVASGVARALIHPELAALWILLAVIGIVVWHRDRRVIGSPWPLLAGALGPCLVTVFALSDPTQARYALPVLALSAGLVVVGLAAWRRGVALVLVTVAVASWLALGLPQTSVVRYDSSPVVSALLRGAGWAAENGGTVVIDRSLLVFADYLEETGKISAPVTTDFSIEIGAVELPPAAMTAAVFDRDRGRFVAAAEETLNLRCSSPWLRRIGPERFLDLTVATGARVERIPSRW